MTWHLLRDLVHWLDLEALQDNPIVFRRWESEPLFKTNLEKEIKRIISLEACSRIVRKEF
ncbi:MAG: hypothetical protein M3O24_03025 [Thermoproteota archaeon]|nr:hypothetical protein [Thermoproteota archaeon]